MRICLISALLLGLLACPPKPPLVTTIPDAQTDAAPKASVDMAQTHTLMAACTPAAKLKQEDICDSFFTVDGLACARCSNVKGCIDEILAMYCATGPCANDPACTYITTPLVTDDPSAASTDNKKSISQVRILTKLGILPNQKLTPGIADPRVTQANIKTTVCAPGYSTSVRPPLSVSSKLKAQAFIAYKVSTTAFGDYELDHLISLELGGSPADIKNLWPEPWENKGNKLAKPGTGAETKDKVENWLHKQLCTGKMTLAEVQKREASNWYDVYKTMQAAKP